MGMDIWVGKGSKDYVNVNLGANIMMLDWYHRIEKKTCKKFKYLYGEDLHNEDGDRIWKVENLPKLLEELDEIYKLKIKGYYDVVKSFRRICKIAIKRQLPMYASY